MSEEKCLKHNINILKPISLSLVGIVIITIISLWLAGSLVAAGIPKKDLAFIALTLCIPATFLGLIPLLIVSYIGFPNYNSKIEYYTNASLGKIVLCLLTGAINTTLTVVLLNIPVLNVIALIFFVIFTSLGLSIICKIVGDKVYLIAREDTTPFKSLITGILLLEMLLILPVLGQLLFAVCLLIGLGGAIIALFIKQVEPSKPDSNTEV